MKRDFLASIFESGFWTQEISHALTFLMIGIASVGLMWYTLATAENLRKSFERSAAVHLEMRPGNEEKLEVQP